MKSNEETQSRLRRQHSGFSRVPHRYKSNYFKVWKSVHYYTIQINQPTRCNSFSSLLLDVYVQLNMFRTSSRPSSWAQELQ